VADEALKPEIERVHRAAYHGVYGAEKVWWQLGREGFDVGRDRVARLMREMGLSGVVRGGHKAFTTTPDGAAQRPEDLVKRNFTASAPNRLWVADLTYVWTWSGFAYTAFVTDVFSRFIVGWRVGTTLAAQLALDALEMGIWARRGQSLANLVHHSDRGVQYLAIVYSTRLEEAGAAPSVGSKGDSFDKALVSYCTSCRWSGQNSLIEPASHTFDQAGVAGCGWLEKPDVLVVRLVRDEQAGTVPRLDRRGAHAEARGDLGNGEQTPGAEPFEVAWQVVASA
jgi:putative transposase